MFNLILPIAALLLNDFLPHENMTPGIQGGVYFFDYLPSDPTVPGNGLFIRASLGYLGEETEPIMIPRIFFTPPSTPPWTGPWPGGTDIDPRGPVVLPPPPPVIVPTPPVEEPVATPEPSSFILLGAGLFCVVFAGEMSRRYRDE